MIDVATAPAVFWAGHYYLSLGEDGPSYFGTTYDRLRFYFRGFTVPDEETPRPEVRCELVDGFRVALEDADCGENGHELRYYLGHEEWDDLELLGYESGHFALPAFRWAELTALHDAMLTAGRSGAESAAALLFLFPATYLTSADDAEGRLTECWWALGVASGIAEMVAALVRRQHRDIRWTLDEDLGWINDGDYSFRNPQTRMTDFSARRFDRVQEFTDALAL